MHVEHARYKNIKQKEFLQQQSDGGPWQTIGTDIFKIQGQNYLVCVDFHSNFIEVDCLSLTTSQQAIENNLQGTVFLVS